MERENFIVAPLQTVPFKPNGHKTTSLTEPSVCNQAKTRFIIRKSTSLVQTRISLKSIEKAIFVLM